MSGRQFGLFGGADEELIRAEREAAQTVNEEIAYVIRAQAHAKTLGDLETVAALESVIEAVTRWGEATEAFLEACKELGS